MHENPASLLRPPFGSQSEVGFLNMFCKWRNGGAEKRVVRVSVKATVERSGGGDGGDRKSGGLMEVTTFSQGFGESEFPVWDKIGAVVRLSYGVGIYGAMALAGNFICSTTGIDSTGGYSPSLDAIVQGLGYAAPPIMALLFILDDEVVKVSPHARAIRDVEYEPFFLWNKNSLTLDDHFCYYWYKILALTDSRIHLYSSLLQAQLVRSYFNPALAVRCTSGDVFVKGMDFSKRIQHGMAALTGILPPFVPFAQAFAAVITAALTGSLYYVAASPKGLSYLCCATSLSFASGRQEMKNLFAAWYERRQMKRIYSPLLEGLLALYLGFEWNQTNNILAPIITHGIYSATILGHGLWKIHDHRRRLRQRVQQLNLEEKNPRNY
ncbi:hypothetical protein Tco_0072942 [Tanacetum coccineum]